MGSSLRASRSAKQKKPEKLRGFKKQKSGEWVQPVMRGYLMGCCDCGLVHRLDFRIVGSRKLKVQFRAYRHIGRTKALRRRQGIDVR